MIDFSDAAIQSISIHHVGVNTDDIGVKYSNRSIDVHNNELHELLLRYFLASFKKPEFFNFSMPGEDLANNAVGNIAGEIFDDPNNVHKHSKRIADHLYANSMHPKIKSGDVMVVYFDDILVEDELVSAVGIYKNEDTEPFLKLIRSQEDYNIVHDKGISVDRLQKGCLILNSEREEGFNVLALDKNKPNGEANYWKKDFLQLRNRIDSYHMTKDTIEATRMFVDHQLKVEAEVDKISEADILNKAKDYFGSLEKFNQVEYANNLFDDDQTRQDFQQYKRQYEENRHVELPDQFEISQPAVRSQSRIFKSVIKLDKNFHIYVHGDRTRISRGVDQDGRRFYKLYYDVEA